MDEGWLWLAIVVVLAIQWIFRQLFGPKEEPPDLSDQGESTSSDSSGGPQKRGSSEEEAYRRLMEALGLPVEEEDPAQREREKRERQERENYEREQRETEERKAAQERRDREREKQRETVPADYGSPEYFRRQHAQRSGAKGADGEEIDISVLEGSQIGTEEIGTGGAEIGAGFSWEDAARQSSTAYAGVGSMRLGMSMGSARGRRGTGEGIDRQKIRKLLSDRKSLRQGIVLREILGPPQANKNAGDQEPYRV